MRHLFFSLRLSSSLLLLGRKLLLLPLLQLLQLLEIGGEAARQLVFRAKTLEENTKALERGPDPF